MVKNCDCGIWFPINNSQRISRDFLSRSDVSDDVCLQISLRLNPYSQHRSEIDESPELLFKALMPSLSPFRGEFTVEFMNPSGAVEIDFISRADISSDSVILSIGLPRGNEEASVHLYTTR